MSAQLSLSPVFVNINGPPPSPLPTNKQYTTRYGEKERKKKKNREEVLLRRHRWKKEKTVKREGGR